MKVEMSAEQTAVVSAGYVKLAKAAADVTVERGPKRVAAIRAAAELVTLGVTLRQAAKAAGKDKPDTGLDRYFSIAKAMLRSEEGAEGAIAPPEGFDTWTDAVAGMGLESLAKHIQDNRAERAPGDVAATVKRLMLAHLRAFDAATEGKGKGKAVKGLTVGRESLLAMVRAWADNGITAAEGCTLAVNDATGAAIVEQVKASATDKATAKAADIIAKATAPKVERITADKAVAAA